MHPIAASLVIRMQGDGLRFTQPILSALRPWRLRSSAVPLCRTMAQIARKTSNWIAMRRVGRISAWQDDRVFGFVVPHDGGDRAFVHIKAFQFGSRRPLDRDLISYSTSKDARSCASYIIYSLDKIAAGKDLRRTPEAALHFLDLLGGWPGALIAQQHFRHKTAKASFQSVFWLTVLVNIVIAAWTVQSGVARFLTSALFGS